MDDVLRINIKNWEKYQERRKDVKKPSWLRLDHEFWMHVDHWDFTNDDLMVYLAVLCEAGKQNTDTPNIHVGRIAVNRHMDTSTVFLCLEKICKYGKISYSRDEHVTSTLRVRDEHVTLHDRTRQDKTRHNKIISLPETPACNPKRRSKKIWQYSESDLAVGSEWLEFAKSEMPWKANDKSWNAERFAEAIAELKYKIGLNDLGIREVLKFIRNDDFWIKVAVSPLGLLRKSEKNGNRKIDNILAKMRTKTDRAKKAMDDWVNEDGKSNNPFL